jgi:hypothetical protein
MQDDRGKILRNVGQYLPDCNVYSPEDSHLECYQPLKITNHYRILWVLYRLNVVKITDVEEKLRS